MWLTDKNEWRSHSLMDKTHQIGCSLSVAISTQQSGNIACSNYTCHYTLKFLVLVQVCKIAYRHDERAWLCEQCVFSKDNRHIQM